MVAWATLQIAEDVMAPIRYRTADVDGIRVFYHEGGPPMLSKSRSQEFRCQGRWVGVGGRRAWGGRGAPLGFSATALPSRL
jgi:hypothetical protein